MSIRPEYRTLGNFLGVEERPATGQNPVTAIRLSDKMRESVDAWAGRQDDIKPRPAKPRIIMAQVEGSGTARIEPNSPSRSPLIPSVKNRVFGSPLLPPVPKLSDQSSGVARARGYGAIRRGPATVLSISPPGSRGEGRRCLPPNIR